MLGTSATMEDVPVGKNKKFPMWEVVEYFIIDFVEKSRSSGYKFESYRWREGEAKAERWPFGQPKKIAQTREVKRIKKELAKKQKT